LIDSSKKKSIIFIFGPTATGKTDLAINLSKKFPIEIISVDSVMVYKGCDIGSAKPEKKTLEQFPHHLVDVIEPDEIFSVADFIQKSNQIINKIHSRKKIPLFVGGTMMYFKSLYTGIHELPKSDKNFRIELDENNNKTNYLYKVLLDIDPIYAKKINKNDRLRIIRAIEVFKKTGKLMSKIFEEPTKKNLESLYQVHQFGICDEREIIHQRIEKRLKKIIDRGLCSEVQMLLKKYNIDDNHPIRKSINYKQAISYLNNEYDINTMYEKALFATRQLAKRQDTWLRNWDNFEQIKIDQIKVIEDKIKKIPSLL
tara:strand:- start:17062 stop:18000 length:939 start_codon:yes stop_codon:yes gene_type:complete